MIREEKPTRLSKVPERFLKLFPKLFNETPDTESGIPEHSQWDHHIPIKEGQYPRLNQVYRLNTHESEALRIILEAEEAKGFIRESESPVGYPVFLVPKKNKDGTPRLDKEGNLVYRHVYDYRQLNDVTIKGGHPLPHIESLKEEIGDSNWFTSLDLKAAFNLIRIAAGDEWKTAIRTPHGHFECLQRMIQTVLRKFLGKSVFVYLDDILIHSKTRK